MDLRAAFWGFLAVACVVGLLAVLLWSMIIYLRGRGSERHGGGISAAVGAALQELDRLAARPSVEHQIEAQRHTTKRDDDSGGE